jgi:hypothetical protein
MNVNEHARLSNLTLRHKFKQRNNSFNAVLHFSHGTVVTNEHNPYPQINVNPPILFTSVNKLQCLDIFTCCT